MQWKKQIMRSATLAGLGGIISLFGARPVVAQVTTAQISGTVHNAANQPVPDAVVTATEVETHESRTVRSSSTGVFLLGQLKPGTYKVTISESGYSAYNVEAVALHAGELATIQAKLQVGSPSTTVTGTATVASGSQSAIAGRAVEDIPQDERNYVNLALIQPGATQGSLAGAAQGDSARPGAEHQNATISANGQPDTLNQHMLDGMDNNDRNNGTALVHPSVEIVSSVQVKTSELTADIGRTKGSALLVSTKSGTNRFHGELFEFFRNDVFDTYPYEFGQTTNLKKLELRQNQFGGSIGGPIIKKHTYFFGDYEGFRLVQGVPPRSIITPTMYEQEHPGDFSDLPGSCNPGPNLTTMDPIGAKYFKLYPKPNATSTATCSGQTVTLQNVWTGTGAASTNFSDTADIRVDHHFSPSSSIFARYGYNKVSSFAPGVLPDVTVDGMVISPGGNLSALAGPQAIHNHNGQLNFTHIFTPHWSATFNFGTTIEDVRKLPLSYGVSPNATWGQPGVNLNDLTSGLAPITVSSGTGIGTGGYQIPNFYHQNNFQYGGTALWTHGKHAVKFGGVLLRRQLISVSNNTGDGNWTFNNYYTLLKGTFKSVNRTYALNTPHLHTWESSAYAMDTWKVMKNLTINAGLRYDVFTPYTDPNNYISTFNPYTGLIQVAGANGISSTAGIHTDSNNFGPRLGLSWDTERGFIVHGGVGVGYIMANVKAKSDLANTPFTYGYGPCSSTGTTGVCPTGFTKFAQGLPTPTTPDINNPSGTITAAVDPKYDSTATTFYNLTIERSFHGNNVTVGYVGSQGRHEPQMVPDINTPLPNTGTYTRPYAATIPKVTSISLYRSEGVSNYNALQAVVSRRMRHHIAFNFNYTYSHGLDDSTGVTAPNNSQTGFGELPNLIGRVVQGHRYDYGNSDMDVRHHLATTLTLESPTEKSARSVFGLISKGWRANAVFSWATGIPYTIVDALNISGTLPGQTNAQRPNLVGNPDLGHHSVNAFFNVNAFAYQQSGTIGQLVNSGSPVGSVGPYQETKDSLHGPHNRVLNAAIERSFPLPRLSSTVLVLRAESFNVTNTTNFAPPNHGLLMDTDSSGLYTIVDTSNQFGQLTTPSASYNPREIQFAAKIQF